MRNFQDTFETPEQSFISTFSICMTIPLTHITMLVKSISIMAISRISETTKYFGQYIAIKIGYPINIEGKGIS